MKNNGRVVSIKGIDVAITGMDYNYPNNKDNIANNKFDITFYVSINNQAFAIDFSNERLTDQNQYIADTFIGNGETYSAFLSEVESNMPLGDGKQYSDDIRNAANTAIGEIAQSVYTHALSHSPDQDEE
ncbi:MAG: hypothetical protein ACSHWN_05635 [Methylophilaceae bacterium]